MQGSVRAFRTWRSKRSALARDSELAVIVAVLAFVPTLSAVGAQIGDLAQRPADGWHVALTLAQCLPLAVRTRWPAVCLVVIAGGFALHQALAYPQTFASLSLYLALYSVGAHHERLQYGLAAVLSAAYVALACVLHVLGSPQGFLDFTAFYLALAAFWVVGIWMRDRRAIEAERRQLSAQAARAAERARISREMHDAVTHHVTALVVQADAAQFVLPDTERVATSLTTISDTGRRALTELRALLGVLEAGAETGATGSARDRLDDLVAQTRHTGQPVELIAEGDASDTGTNAHLATYRVVQESLTNAVKYAPGRPTRVSVRHSAEQIDVEVTTEGPPPGAAAADRSWSGGRGLAGLRERTAMLGGDLVAEMHPDGGFTVRAEIPARSGA